MRRVPLIVTTAAFGALLGGCATTLETGPGYYHYDTHAVGNPPVLVHEAPAVVYHAPDVVTGPTAVVTGPPTVINGQPTVVYTNPPVLYSQPGVIYQPAIVDGDSVLMYRYHQPAANSAYAHDHGQ
jgi:hypothetical protein